MNPDVVLSEIQKCRRWIWNKQGGFLDANIWGNKIHQSASLTPSPSHEMPPPRENGELGAATPAFVERADNFNKLLDGS